MVDCENFVLDVKNDPVRAAILLAMTKDQASEAALIEAYARQGIRCAATMVSGRDFENRPRMTRNVIGLCLGASVVEKKTEHVHPLAHAIQEATVAARIMDSAAAQNYRVKAAAARCGIWIAVCFYGDMGMHECSAHRTIGIGVQVLIP